MMNETLMVDFHPEGVIFPTNSLLILVCPFSIICKQGSREIKDKSKDGMTDPKRRKVCGTFDMIPHNFLILA